MPLKILSYDELYGWTMDAIVSKVGKKNNCTFCGVFRRQALDRGATMLNVDHIVTGHNADDIAETVLMNSKLLSLTVHTYPCAHTLQSCVVTLLGWEGARQYVRKAKTLSSDQSRSNTLTRKKSSCEEIPLIFCMDHSLTCLCRYAYFKKLDYFSTECIYSPDAYRGHARVFLKDLEAARPSAIIDIIHSGEAFEIKEEVRATQKLQRMQIFC